MPESCQTQDCCLPDPFDNPIEPDTGNFLLEIRIDPEDSGTVTGDGEHEEGSEVTITATPEDSFIFLRWEDLNGFVISEDSTYTFTITQNLIWKAVFEAV